MPWTKTKPTSPGTYEYRDKKDGPCLFRMEVIGTPQGLRARAINGWFHWPLADLPGEWKQLSTTTQTEATDLP